MIKHNSIPGKVIDFVTTGEITLLGNFDILDEYEDVLTRSKFSFAEEEVHNYLCMLREKMVIIDSQKCEESFIDLEDVKFYEVTISFKEDQAYLVTGNKKHFPEKAFIVSPNEMVEIIEN
ncbi:MAG: PIN domain-containing protein [Clostridia bacterium]|nr:PIN domain-containing protein [Clostridia bacterium]